jgi:ubiquinone/menaquinone biosynthesis C-methylase UbiE
MMRIRKRHNPWLDIPAADYEGHMSHESVGQLQALSEIFREIVTTFEPRRLAVLGCATGNGFEHIRPKVTETVVAVDVNQEYLGILKRRFEDTLPGLQLTCGDVTKVRLAPRSFDHVHTGLIFEYVDPRRLLERIAEWLEPGGVLSVVLQVPSPQSAPVTETSYDSLKRLEPVMRLVHPAELAAAAYAVGLAERKSFEVELQQGKKFRVIYFVSKTV